MGSQIPDGSDSLGIDTGDQMDPQLALVVRMVERTEATIRAESETTRAQIRDLDARLTSRLDAQNGRLGRAERSITALDTRTKTMSCGEHAVRFSELQGQLDLVAASLKKTEPADAEISSDDERPVKRRSHSGKVIVGATVGGFAVLYSFLDLLNKVVALFGDKVAPGK